MICFGSLLSHQFFPLGRHSSSIFNDLVWAKRMALKVDEILSAARLLLFDLKNTNSLIEKGQDLDRDIRVCGFSANLCAPPPSFTFLFILICSGVFDSVIILS